MLSKRQDKLLKKKKTAKLNNETIKQCCFLVSCIKKFVVLQLTGVSDVGVSARATTNRAKSAKYLHTELIADKIPLSPWLL